MTSWQTYALRGLEWYISTLPSRHALTSSKRSNPLIPPKTKWSISTASASVLRSFASLKMTKWKLIYVLIHPRLMKDKNRGRSKGKINWLTVFRWNRILCPNINGNINENRVCFTASNWYTSVWQIVSSYFFINEKWGAKQVHDT